MPREYLLFRLSGPLASWGEIAVGERRSSWPRPSKSAVLGLVAAALGYDRLDAPAHAALNDGLRFAVRVDTPLKPLRDYHTAQAPSAERNTRWETRAAELEARKLNTILSERWYWTHMTATVALWPFSESPLSLNAIKNALEQPKFALYLGRKSCVLGRPLFPQIVETEGFAEAFPRYDVLDQAKAGEAGKAIPEKEGRLRGAIMLGLETEAAGEIWADLDAIPAESRTHTHSRRDAIRDRRAWTFSDRTEGRVKTGGTDVPL